MDEGGYVCGWQDLSHHVTTPFDKPTDTDGLEINGSLVVTNVKG